MATIVQCNCGAEYRRTEEKFLAPHTGDAPRVEFGDNGVAVERLVGDQHVKANPSMSGGTTTVSKSCPGRSTKRTRLSARILVVTPPFGPPIA
jgi:hypothetical protein